MRLQLIDIEEIKLKDNNRNDHPESQIQELMESISKVGMRVPVILSEDFELQSGYGRLEACKRLNLSQIPALIQEFDNEAEKYVFSVSDNALARKSKIDYRGIKEDLEDFDWTDFEVSDLRLDFQFEPDPVESTSVCLQCGKPL